MLICSTAERLAHFINLTWSHKLASLRTSRWIAIVPPVDLLQNMNKFWDSTCFGLARSRLNAKSRGDLFFLFVLNRLMLAVRDSRWETAEPGAVATWGNLDRDVWWAGAWKHTRLRTVCESGSRCIATGRFTTNVRCRKEADDGDRPSVNQPLSQPARPIKFK